MEIPQQKVIAGAEFRTLDHPTQIVFDLQSSLPYSCVLLRGRKKLYFLVGS